MLDTLKGVPNVLLVNVRVPRSWQAEVNSELNAAVARHPGVKLVDWFGFSGPHGDWFESDHTHLKEAGMAAFADMIVGAIPPPPPPHAAPGNDAVETPSNSSVVPRAVQAIRTGAKPLIDAKSGRDPVEIILGVYESARTGKARAFSEVWGPCPPLPNVAQHCQPPL